MMLQWQFGMPGGAGSWVLLLSLCFGVRDGECCPSYMGAAVLTPDTAL